MSAAVQGGPRIWGLTRDEDGHRDAKVTLLVVTEDVLDSPLTVLTASGTPIIGSAFDWGNEVDPWLLCHPNADITQVFPANEPGNYYEITYTYSTRPIKRCQDAEIEDPLLEPAKISFGFSTYRKRVDRDANGVALLNLQHEPIDGIEKDDSWPTIVIEQNILLMDLPLLTQVRDTLNSDPLWGFGARQIKLSACSGEEKYYGTCSKYWTRRLEFKVKDTWDEEDIMNAGWKVIRGKWVKNGAIMEWVPDNDADVDNPADFVRAKDFQDQPFPNRIPVDLGGRPILDPADIEFLAPIPIYPPAGHFGVVPTWDFLNLPTSIE